jgi:hypothetical protein
MVDVYQNCFLCIAAAGAEGSDKGLLAERDPLVYKPCEMTMPPKRKKRLVSALHVPNEMAIDSERERIVAYPQRASKNDFQECFKGAALHKRGCVTQDRILWPRTLNFGTIMVWKCREHCQAEFGLSPEADFETLKCHFSTLVLGDIGGELSSNGARNIWALWHRIFGAGRHWG